MFWGYSCRKFYDQQATKFYATKLFKNRLENSTNI